MMLGLCVFYHCARLYIQCPDACVMLYSTLLNILLLSMQFDSVKGLTYRREVERAGWKVGGCILPAHNVTIHLVFARATLLFGALCACVFVSLTMNLSCICDGWKAGGIYWLRCIFRLCCECGERRIQCDHLLIKQDRVCGTSKHTHTHRVL